MLQPALATSDAAVERTYERRIRSRHLPQARPGPAGGAGTWAAKQANTAVAVTGCAERARSACTALQLARRPRRLNTHRLRLRGAAVQPVASPVHSGHRGASRPTALSRPAQRCPSQLRPVLSKKALRSRLLPCLVHHSASVRRSTHGDDAVARAVEVAHPPVVGVHAPDVLHRRMPKGQCA